MNWLNYDKLYKFLVSLGITLIGISFLIMFVYTWFLTEEVDSIVNLRGPSYYKKEGFNETKINEILINYDQKMKLVSSLSDPLFQLSNLAFYIGSFSLLFGGIWWYYEEHHRKKHK